MRIALLSTLRLAAKPVPSQDAAHAPFGLSLPCRKKVLKKGAESKELSFIFPSHRGMFRMRSYRHQGTKKVSRDGEQVLEWVDMEPIVLYKGIKGNPMKENVLVRVHDQCFTSEVMGSRRCDCREQLELAMEMVQKQGGAIIYLPQEVGNISFPPAPSRRNAFEIYQCMGLSDNVVWPFLSGTRDRAGEQGRGVPPAGPGA
jgi:hypothetical protein